MWHRPQRYERGFTVIELATTMVIASILVGMAVSTYSRAKPRLNLNNAAHELVSHIAMAQMRAITQQSNVWVIFVEPAAGAGGGYIVYEDVVGTLNLNTAVTDFATRPGLVARRVLAEVDYERGAYERSQVGLQTAGQTVTLRAPYSGTASVACNFCSGTPKRGAVLLQPDGEARFVKHDNTGAGVDVGHVMLAHSEAKNATAIAITAATGMVRAFK